MTQIAIITGAGRGLGRNTTLALARKGNDIVVTYRNSQADAESLVTEIEALGRKAVSLQLDAAEVSQFGAFAKTLTGVLTDHFGADRFDYLVNNAGEGAFAPFPETTEVQFDGLMQVHVKGVYFLIQTLLPMIADGGAIVNIGSGLTRVTYPGFSAYTIAKAAVDMMTVCLAKELGGRGIRVNSVAPGAIETDFGGGLVRDDPDVNRQFSEMTALGRVGVPDDIGPMIASLLTDENRWVTAQRIEVSGGQAI